MQRQKRKNITEMKSWEQIVEFKFIEDGQNMEWKEKFFITAPNKEKAKEISEKFIKRKKEENKKTENFCALIEKDLYPSKSLPLSNISIHGQIIDINIL